MEAMRNTLSLCEDLLNFFHGNMWVCVIFFLSEYFTNGRRGPYLVTLFPANRTFINIPLILSAVIVRLVCCASGKRTAERSKP